MSEFELKLYKATAEDLGEIVRYATLLELDASPTSADSYTVAKINSQIAGFVREKKHADCTELSTLGVIPQHQNKSIGQILVKDFLQKTTANTIYVVTVIPDYFKKFGFTSTCNYPSSLKEKEDNCKNICNTDDVSIMVYNR